MSYIFPLLIAVLALSAVSAPAVRASGIAPDDVISFANDARADEGLAPLIANGKLARAAQAKAEDMLKNDYFAHTSPDGIAPWHWIKQAGYQYKAAGENLAINFDSAKEQHSAWMKSATHRANILNTQYKEIGVAIAKGNIDGQESVVTVEFFGTPFYAAADRTVAVPPVQKAPADIKGIETQAETTMPGIFPVLPSENAVPKRIMQPLPIRTMPWLDIITFVFAGILAFIAFASPMAFLVAAYASLIALLRARHASITAVFESHRTGMEYHLRI